MYVFIIVVLTQTRYGAAVSVSQMKTVNRIQVRSLGVSDSFSLRLFCFTHLILCVFRRMHHGLICNI